MIELDWDHETGEGSLKINKQFVISHRIVQLDALQDWIFELTDLYETMLGEQFLGEENESKKKPQARHSKNQTQ